jgi:ssDNA-binding Zn-finger/Zn-ribbon topoisomerase 1
MPDIRCPKCGKKTTLRTNKKDDSQYFVCVKYPKCKGQVPVEEDLSGVLGQESPAPEAAHDRLRQHKEPSPAKSTGGTAIRKLGKAKRGSHAVIKRPGRKGQISIDKSKGEDREKPAPKPANDRLNRRRIAPAEEMPSMGKEPPELKGQRKSKLAFYRPLYKRGPGPGPVLPQETERSKPAPYRPLFKRAKRWETVPEGQGQSEPQGQKESKPMSSRPQYRRRPKAAPVLPREPERLKPAPYQPQYQKPPRWETVPESNEPSEPKGHRKSKLAFYRPLYRKGPKPAPVLPQEPSGPPPTPYRPQFPRAQKRGVSSGEQKPPKPRRHKAPKAAHEEPRPQKAPKPAQERPQ